MNSIELLEFQITAMESDILELTNRVSEINTTIALVHNDLKQVKKAFNSINVSEVNQSKEK